MDLQNQTPISRNRNRAVSKIQVRVLNLLKIRLLKISSERDAFAENVKNDSTSYLCNNNLKIDFPVVKI